MFTLPYRTLVHYKRWATNGLNAVLADGAFPGQAAEAAQLCTLAMRAAQVVGGSITAESALSQQAEPIGWSVSPEVANALTEAEEAARELDALQRGHRATVLGSVTPANLTAADALARIDAVRRLDRIAHHAWRSAAHLLGRGVKTEDGAPSPHPP